MSASSPASHIIVSVNISIQHQPHHHHHIVIIIIIIIITVVVISIRRQHFFAGTPRNVERPNAVSNMLTGVLAVC